ncbi:MAG: twin-arginine translocase subunit TatC [Candidatus Promineifilaceae bacterium]
MNQVVEESPQSEMSLLGHLSELRRRLVWVGVGLLVGTLISFIFAEALLQFLTRPYGDQLQTLRPTEGVETYFKIALASGAILSMPIILLQVWKFISPGLLPRERRYVYVFLPSAMVLFLLGIAFAWYVLLPAAITFLDGFLNTVFVTEWTSQEYIGFLTTFLFWIGVSFEMPVIIYFIARVGIVSAATLREQWRTAMVIIAILAAAVTPTVDPVTMLLTMAPLIVLYVLSLGLARIGQRQFERAMALEN